MGNKIKNQNKTKSCCSTDNLRCYSHKLYSHKNVLFSNWSDKEVEMTSQAMMASIIDSEKVIFILNFNASPISTFTFTYIFNTWLGQSLFHPIYIERHCQHFEGHKNWFVILCDAINQKSPNLNTVFKCNVCGTFRVIFWWKPHKNWPHGSRDITILVMLNTIKYKGIWILLLALSKNQY